MRTPTQEYEIYARDEHIKVLEGQLQQAEERGAAVKRAFEKWSNTTYFGGEELDSLIHAIDALTSPSQPSRYREMEKVVEIVKKIGFHLSRHHRKECNCPYCQLYDALTALDQAGEGAG